MATGPGNWVYDEDSTRDPQAVCPHCETDHGQVLGGAGSTVRCRCTNPACGRTFLHIPWQDKELRGVRHSRRGAALRPDVRVAPPTNSGPRALGPGAGKAEPVRTRPLSD